MNSVPILDRTVQKTHVRLRDAIRDHLTVQEMAQKDRAA
jgi:hypothetical protein